MLLDLLKMFFEIEPLQYFYIFLGLTGILILVVRKKLSIEDDITHYITITPKFQGNHPELKEKQDSRNRLHLLQITISILMVLVTIAGTFRYTIGVGDYGQRMVQRFEDSRQWNDKPIRQSFVTQGRFNDTGTITIKYDLIIYLPNGKQLEDLKSIYRNPARLLDTYLKPYLFLISAATCASYLTNEAHTDKFTNFIKSQVLNGLDPSLGILTSDIGKPPKSYGINIVVETIEYTFDDTIRSFKTWLEAETTTEKKRRTELPTMEEWVESQKEKK